MNDLASTSQVAAACKRRPAPVRDVDRDLVVRALLAGGDGRIALDPSSGRNKYLCPAEPLDGGVIASSCTASPISRASFEHVAEIHASVVEGPRMAPSLVRIEEYESLIQAALLRHFQIDGAAQVILCPSGTDALLLASAMLAAETPGRPITAILPSASETGSGVPLAVACRAFDGPRAGVALTQQDLHVVEVPVRGPDGQPLPEDVVSEAFQNAAAGEHGRRPIVYRTHGTKTGLIVPRHCDGVDVVVDACQARIDGGTVGHYIARGHPVVVTGSKFYGGPAFSGAVLFPLQRLSVRHHAAWQRMTGGGRDKQSALGVMLRWMAAIDVMQRFAAQEAGQEAGMADLVRRRATAIEAGLLANPALLPIGGLRPQGTKWSQMPSIFTFAVQGPVPGRLMFVHELQGLHQALAQRGVLVGQPVHLGGFGGLRIAVGARDLIEGPPDGGLARVFAELAQLTRGSADAA